MNKKQKGFSNKFKNFVLIAVRKILNHSDLPEYKFDINFVYEDVHDSKNNHHTVQAEIDVMPEYQNFTLTVYKDLENEYNRGCLNEVFDILCHEIGHVHTQKIYDLAREPYKTEKETDMVNEELSTKEGLDILDQLSELKIQILNFSGGEPFLRKDIFTLLDHARNFPSITITTNGTLLNKRKIIKKL